MFCYNCGAKVFEGAKFCQKCGTQVQEDAGKPAAEPQLEQVPQPEQTYNSEPAPVRPDEPTPAQQRILQQLDSQMQASAYRNAGFQEQSKFSKQDYAGFWLRFAASLLDGIILGIPAFIIAFVVIFVYVTANPYSDTSGIEAFGQIIAIVISWLYYALMESSSMQATLGKKIVGIKVTDLNGNRISFGKATGRYFGKILSSILYIGFIMAGVTEKKQGLHDMIAGCLVIKK